MAWIDDALKAGIRVVRAGFYGDSVTIHDVSFSTGAGMYRKDELVHARYTRDADLSLTAVSRREETGPGGFHNLGGAQIALNSSSTGVSGPTNRSLLLRTGSANAVYFTAQNTNWSITNVAEDIVAEELVCDVEKMT